MRWSVAIIRAIVIFGALFGAGVCTLELGAALRFDGSCGGFMPFLAAAHSCTLSEYLWGSMSFSILVLLQEFWGWLLVALFLVLAASVAVERRRSRRNAA
jgi:hypothetical protein